MTPSPAPPDDPRVRLAAERTLLAWVRTGLALMGFGFVVARFGLFLREMAALRPAEPPHAGAGSVWVGTVLVLLGVAAHVYAAVGLGGVLRRLERGDPLVPSRAWGGPLLAGLLAVVGLTVAAYLALVSH